MSVLQEMTKGIMTTKATKAARLTPVEGESGMTVEQAARVLPRDLPNRFMAGEELVMAARDLRAKAQQFLEIADSIDLMMGESSLPVFGMAEAARKATKQAEAAADAARAAEQPVLPTITGIEDSPLEDLTARMKRLSAEAQAKVYGSADDDGTIHPAAPAPAVEGWQCPDHGASDLKDLKARSGREYRMCGVGDCEEYEKE